MAPPAAPDQQHPLVTTLAGRGLRPAVVLGDRVVSYVELSERVAGVARGLGPTRRLVLIEGRSTLGWLVGYLAALAARCPVLLVPPGDSSSEVVRAYDPDVRLVLAGDDVQLVERRAASAHELHPDLALLLSTSGSSGSPKLVRLSGANLLANAACVADSLGIRASDRAITSLPVHYCYGLSVVHSHLLRGAALVLTELSVVEESFWELFQQTQATCLAGVPYTFDLLDRAGFAGRELPSLRYVTQAGGRLAPERIRAYAELGTRRGWDLVVMYGQTEATARMAVLPPALAATRPTAIGMPVAGGAFCLERVDERPGPVLDGEVGELVYTGPNVMLGYATGPQDLSRGPEFERLRTGDLARRAPDGLYEVVGRSSRFLKLFGLRLDQGHVEQELRRLGVAACCEPAPHGRLGVVVEGATAARQREVADRVVAVTGLPRHAVRVVAVDGLPRRPSGKPDLAAVRDLLARSGPPAQDAADLRGVFAQVLGVEAGEDDTFVGLGGDSLSYVEMTVRLERVLGHVPVGWHLRRIGELAAGAAAASGAAPVRAGLDVTLALRAVAILLVVGSHSKVFDLLGGAHLLLVLAGYNLARFQLAAPRRARALGVVRSIRRIAVPAAAWSAGVLLLTDEYGWQNVLLLNHVLGPQEWGSTWNFWFLEALVLLMAAVAAAVSLRPVDRWQRRRLIAFALVLVSIGLLVRFDVLGVDTGPRGRFTAQAVLWLFALGMAAAHARGRTQRAVVAALAAGGMGLVRRPAARAGGPRGRRAAGDDRRGAEPPPAHRRCQRPGRRLAVHLRHPLAGVPAVAARAAAAGLHRLARRGPGVRPARRARRTAPPPSCPTPTSRSGQGDDRPHPARAAGLSRHRRRTRESPRSSPRGGVRRPSRGGSRPSPGARCRRSRRTARRGRGRSRPLASW